MNLTIKLFTLLFIVGFVKNTSAQEKEKPINLELTGTFTHFEQQIKTDIGGIKGELLAADTELGIQLLATYKIWTFIHAGWYFQYDLGKRENAQFNGFDSTGAAQVSNLTGGSFNEFWTGPLIRAQYKQAFFEVGYGLVGIRNDDARGNLKNTESSNEGSFTTTPTIAWLIGIGAQVNLTDQLSLLVKAQYRVRYYDKRDGVALKNKAVHGTQNFSPLIGISYKL